jgi:ligand-binding sensor domain-containing protein
MRRLAILLMLSVVFVAACGGSGTDAVSTTLASPSATTTSVAPPTSSATAIPQAAGPEWTSFSNRNVITDVAIGLDGAVWTSGPGGVVRWDPEDCSYVTYGSEDGLASNYVSSLAVDADGSVWLAGGGQVTVIVDGQVVEPPAAAAIVHPNLVQAGLDGSLWLIDTYASAGSRGALRFDGGAWQEMPVPEFIDPPEYQPLAIGPDGSAWFVRGFEVVFRWDGSVWETFEISAAGEDWYPRGIVADDSGHIWVSGAGLARWDGTAWSHYPFSEDPKGHMGQLQGLDVAPDGTVWVVQDGGVHHFDGSGWTAFDTTDGLPTPMTTSVTVAEDGIVWVGTEKGLARFDGEVWDTCTTDDPPELTRLGGTSVMTVGFGSDGMPVVATEEGVLRFDGSSWANLGTPWDFGVSVQPFYVVVAADGSVLTSGRGGMAQHDGDQWALVEGPAGLEVESVMALRSEPDGTITAGFLHLQDGEQAASVGFGSGGDWTILGPEEGLPQGLVTSLAWDSSGALWVGLWGYIARCDDRSCEDVTDEVLLTGGEIHAVASDPDGHVWVASEEDLWEVDGDEVTVHVEDHVPIAPAFTTDGETVDHIGFPDFALAAAPDGTIWLGTAHFDGERWTVYDSDDGLAAGQAEGLFPNVGVAGQVEGVWVSPDGSVWFTIFHDGLSRHIPGGDPVIGSPTMASGMAWADAPATTFEVPPEPPVWPTQ